MGKKWKLRRSEPVLSTEWLSVFRNEYDLGDGKTVNNYYVVERDDFVLIVALDADELLLVQQYRAATDKCYTALPAGYLSAGESPEACARRELLEETGYTATTCRVIAKLDPLPGYIKSSAYVVFCTAERARDAKPDLDEINAVIRVPYDTVLPMILRGEIDEMQAVAAILLAKVELGRQGTSANRYT